MGNRALNAIQYPWPKVSLIGLAAVCSLTANVNVAAAPSSPAWWLKTRAIYAAHALSGAGGPFMKFPSQDIRDLKSFRQLPAMLKEAERLGCHCLYLVDYWEGGYENKGDYAPRNDLGGAKAFKQGIAAVHAQGGRVLLYLEAFIVHRQSQAGRQHGLDWAMLDERGQPYTYYGRSRFYLMYPGEGSGWTEYLCRLAEHLTRDYGVDGFHLDSYGLQWDWKDYHPKHPGGRDPQHFNQGAIRLVESLRARIRRINPEAIVILEGCERAELLNVCDGGQLDNAAWQYSPLKTLAEKSWFNERTYKSFTSHFSLPEMERILKLGYNYSLAPWWFQELPQESDFKTLRQPMKDGKDWYKRILRLWHWENLLYANGISPPPEIDLFKLRRDLERQQYVKPNGPHETPEYLAAVEALEPLVRELLSTHQSILTPANYLRRLVTAAESDGPDF